MGGRTLASRKQTEKAPRSLRCPEGRALVRVPLPIHAGPLTAGCPVRRAAAGSGASGCALPPAPVSGVPGTQHLGLLCARCPSTPLPQAASHRLELQAHGRLLGKGQEFECWVFWARDKRVVKATCPDNVEKSGFYKMNAGYECASSAPALSGTQPSQRLCCLAVGTGFFRRGLPLSPEEETEEKLVALLSLFLTVWSQNFLEVT